MSTPKNDQTLAAKLAAIVATVGCAVAAVVVIVLSFLF
jgi:hypothetical protein